MNQPSPGELWQQAEGNGDEYRRLLAEYGYLVPRKPGDDNTLPCGWKPKNRPSPTGVEDA